VLQHAGWASQPQGPWTSNGEHIWERNPASLFSVENFIPKFNSSQWPLILPPPELPEQRLPLPALQPSACPTPHSKSVSAPSLASVSRLGALCCVEMTSVKFFTHSKANFCMVQPK